MKYYIIIASFISLLSFHNSLPHFIYDGIDSFHESLGEINKVTFTLYGSLSEEINPEKMYIQNYLIEDMGEFKCSLLNNKETENEKRTHKIECSITGNFERNGYILEEPKLYGFDFLDENGKTTWPEDLERKMFLIGEIGERIELNNEPLLLGNINPYENPLNKVRKDTVNKAIKSLPERRSVSKQGMIESMSAAAKSYHLSEAEIAYMIFLWETQNIVYDCYDLRHDESKIDYTEDGTYNKGEGVCAGYSKIFRTFANSLGLEAYYVNGFTKYTNFIQGKMPLKTEHAWNSVKIDNIYYLVDSTWGAGGCDEDKFAPKLKEFYFCTDPEIFIRSHLPIDKKWQLLSPTITIQQFVDILKLPIDFYSQGFKTVSPDKTTFNTNGDFTINLTYDSSSKKNILYSLYYLESNTFKEQQNACWVDAQQASATVKCFANNKGLYKLKLYGGGQELDSYPKIVEYNITSTKTALTPKSFPHAYKLFSTSDLKITEPFYNPLIRGTFINFKMKTTTFKNIYIINKADNNKHFSELDNNGKGEFTGEVYIFGKEVVISSKDVDGDGKYNHIVTYETIRNSNSAIDASFPESYTSAPKNILYSPLTERLQCGKIYYFEIKCDSVNEVVVIDGNNFNKLEKKGNKFSGQVKINCIGTEVKLSYLKDNGYYYKFYLYKTSK